MTDAIFPPGLLSPGYHLLGRHDIPARWFHAGRRRWERRHTTCGLIGPACVLAKSWNKQARDPIQVTGVQVEAGSRNKATSRRRRRCNGASDMRLNHRVGNAFIGLSLAEDLAILLQHDRRSAPCSLARSCPVKRADWPCNSPQSSVFSGVHVRAGCRAFDHARFLGSIIKMDFRGRALASLSLLNAWS